MRRFGARAGGHFFRDGGGSEAATLRSAIFLRSVFRLRPKISAAFNWLFPVRSSTSGGALAGALGRLSDDLRADPDLSGALETCAPDGCRAASSQWLNKLFRVRRAVSRTGCRDLRSRPVPP